MFQEPAVGDRRKAARLRDGHQPLVAIEDGKGQGDRGLLPRRATSERLPTAQDNAGSAGRLLDGDLTGTDAESHSASAICR